MYRQSLEQYLDELHQTGSLYEIPDVQVVELSEDEQRIITEFEEFARRLVVNYQKVIREVRG